MQGSGKQWRRVAGESGVSELGLEGTSWKKRQRLTILWIVSQFELQSYCLSGPGDLDFFLYPICWCSAAWGGDLAAGLCGEGGLGN